MIELTTPISEEAVANLQVGDTVEISGYILCGRDAVLPKVIKMIEEGMDNRKKSNVFSGED